MKTALIAYHKNIHEIYKKEWIDEYRESILNQTYKNFDIVELNYGGGTERIFENSNFYSKQFPSFAHGLNYLLDCLFFMGYDCVANSNVDDVYSPDRLAKQLPYIESGYDIATSNFALIQDGETTLTHEFDKLDLELELANNHNIICHPTVCYSKKFWEKHRYIPEQQPLEDLMLWQRAIKDSWFKIVPDYLVQHRIHENSVCQSENR